MKTLRKSIPSVSSGSMADIAFLLLIFFLVTTTILHNKGLTILLPPKTEDIIDIPLKERNLFKISINSKDQLLVEGEVWNKSLEALKKEAKNFILNNGLDKKTSENPEKAILSFKTNRGTTYDMYIKVLNELKGAYYEIYAEKVGLNSQEFRNLNQRNPEDLKLFQKGKSGIPMNISIAEPTL